MYESSYGKGNIVKMHPYILPNGYLPTTHYNDIYPTNTGASGITSTVINPIGNSPGNLGNINHGLNNNKNSRDVERNEETTRTYTMGPIHTNNVYINKCNENNKKIGRNGNSNINTKRDGSFMIPIIKSSSGSSVSNPNNCNNKNHSCLTNFSCFQKTNKMNERLNKTKSSNNYKNQKYVVKNLFPVTNREYFTSLPQHQYQHQNNELSRASNENIYTAVNNIQNYDLPSPVPPSVSPTSILYNTKYMTTPKNMDKIKSYEYLPNITQNLNNDNGVEYIYENYSNPDSPIHTNTNTNIQTQTQAQAHIPIPTTTTTTTAVPVNTSLPPLILNRKNQIMTNGINKTNRKIHKQNINELIQMKDKQIKELEKDVEQEKDLGNYNDMIENTKLEKKLLNQKIKYEETLKHVKKLEQEKRTLKKNLCVRDKVLNKLENDISSVDNENNFLRNVKENTSINEIHNVFKYLHGNDNNKLLKNKSQRIKKSGYKENDDDEEEEEEEDDDEEEGINKILYKKKNKKKLKKKKNVLDGNDIFALKTTVVELEKEISDLKEENKNVHFKYENTFKTLSELRKDALEYMESIVSRDTRIAYMETALQKCEKDLLKLKEHFKKQKMMYENKINECVSEIKVLEKQSAHLQEMIHEKDSQIVLLKSEIVRNETLIKQYEERNKELQSELRLMCNNLESVIEASNKKDIFMNELEKQLRENEVNRQHAYLKEVAKNRKVHTNMKFKEILYDKSAKHKMNEVFDLKQKLYLNNIQVDKAKEAFKTLNKVQKFECLLPLNGATTEYDFNNEILEYSQHNQIEKTEAADSLELNVESDCSDNNITGGKKKKTGKTLITDIKFETEKKEKLEKEKLNKINSLDNSKTKELKKNLKK